MARIFRIRAHLSVTCLSNGLGVGPLYMPLFTYYILGSTLSPNTLLQWDDNLKKHH